MKKLLNSVAALAMVALLCSCSDDEDVVGLPHVEFTDIVYMVNESSHQIYMSSVDVGMYHETDVRLYPENIGLDSADSAVDGSNIWNTIYNYWNEVNKFFTPSYMTVTIDGIYSYNLYSYAGSARCKCSSCSCKCGDSTVGESDYCCMCGADVINPCKYNNWTLVSVNGDENTGDHIHINEDGTTVCVWNFTITEEMAEETLRLLAEDN